MMNDSCKYLWQTVRSVPDQNFSLSVVRPCEHGFTVFLFSCSWYPCKAMQGFRSNNIVIKSDPEGGVGELAHTCAASVIGALDRADVWWWKPDNRGHARINFYFNEATAVQHHSWRLPCTKTLTRGKREKKSTWQWRRICMYVIDGVMEAVWYARKLCMNPIIHRVIKALAISDLKKTLEILRGNYRIQNSFSSFLSFLC